MSKEEMKNQQIIDTMDARANEVISGLVIALGERGHTVETHQDKYAKYPNITIVDGVPVGLVITFERSGSYRLSFGHLNGKLRMRMSNGSYGVNNYPEPKNGFVNSKTIERIEALLRHKTAEKVCKDAEAKKKAAALETLKTFLSKQKHGQANGEGYTLKACSETRVNLSADVTLEQLSQIAAILSD